MTRPKLTLDGPFVGWCRIAGEAWQAVCSARTHEECLDLIIYHLPHGKYAEKLVLPRGKHPEKGRKRPR